MPFPANVYSLIWLSKLFNVKVQLMQPYLPTFSTYQSNFILYPIHFFFSFTENHCGFVHFPSNSNVLIPNPAQDRFLTYKIPCSNVIFFIKLSVTFCVISSLTKTENTHTHTAQYSVVDLLISALNEE